MIRFKNFVYERLYPVLAGALLHAICRTLRIESIGEDTLEFLRRSDKRVVYAFWHGRHFLLAHYMGNRNASVVVSPSHDGRLIANILRKSGFDIVTGSSHRNPVRALIEAMKQMQAGKDIAFTVDGPRGPIHKVKPGAVYLAKKMQAPIIPITVGFKNCFTLRSWDRYRIPQPFTRAVLLFGEPFRPNTDLHTQEIEKACRELESILNQISAEADQLAGK